LGFAFCQKICTVGKSQGNGWRDLTQQRKCHPQSLTVSAPVFSGGFPQLGWCPSLSDEKLEFLKIEIKQSCVMFKEVYDEDAWRSIWA
jgi:hypothetical protein